MVTFGLAIAGFSLDSQLHGSFGLAITWFPVDSQLHGILWTRNCMDSFGLAIAWFPFDSPLDSLIASELRVSFIPGFIFQDWECFGGLGLASRPRLALLYIPGFIFLVVYSWFYIPGLVVTWWRPGSNLVATWW